MMQRSPLSFVSFTSCQGRSYLFSIPVTLLALLVTQACGSDDAVQTGDAAAGETGVATDGSTSQDTSSSTDPYEGATWSTENVSQSPTQITHDGRFVFAPADKSFVFAYAEPDALDLARQSIMVATKKGSAWVSDQMTPNVKQQFSFPSLANAAGTTYLLYNGYTPTTWNDILVHIRGSNGTWGGAVNVTGSNAGDAGSPSPRDNVAPTAAETKTGLAVAYASQPVIDNKRADPMDIRVVAISKAGLPLSAPVVVVTPASGKSCKEPSIVSDAQGNLHVLALCGSANAHSVHYATNRTGAWTSKEISTEKECSSPEIRVGADGKVLHAVWGTGGPISYRSIDAVSGVMSDVRSIGAGPDFEPSVTEDARGYLLFVYHRNIATGPRLYGDVYFAWSPDGGKTFKETNLTPDTDGLDDYFPGSLTMDPDGKPAFTYDTVRGPANELNRDILLMRMK